MAEWMGFLVSRSVVVFMNDYWTAEFLIDDSNRFFLSWTLFSQIWQYCVIYGYKTLQKKLHPVGIEPKPLFNLWFQVQHYPFWATWKFIFKSETLGSLYSHALLILTYTSESKNQEVHEQKFKDPLSRTCQISPERRELDLESEVNQRPGFYSHWG